MHKLLVRMVKYKLKQVYKYGLDLDVDSMELCFSDYLENTIKKIDNRDALLAIAGDSIDFCKGFDKGMLVAKQILLDKEWVEES